jgi:hypothetical protein
MKFCTFIDLISLGNLNGAKTFITNNINPDTNLDEFISLENETAFGLACQKGYLEIAKWLLELKPTIDISAQNNYAFRFACKYRQLHVAKWLIEINPDLNISADNDFAYRWSYQNRNFEISEWLHAVKINRATRARTHPVSSVNQNNEEVWVDNWASDY